MFYWCFQPVHTTRSLHPHPHRPPSPTPTTLTHTDHPHPHRLPHPHPPPSLHPPNSLFLTIASYSPSSSSPSIFRFFASSCSLSCALRSTIRSASCVASSFYRAQPSQSDALFKGEYSRVSANRITSLMTATAKGHLECLKQLKAAGA